MKRYSSTRKQMFAPGAVARIPLERDTSGYAHLLVEPWIRVLDCFSQGQPDLPEILSAPALYVLAVDTWGVRKGRWPIVGQSALSSDERQLPDQFIQDLFDPSNLRVVSYSQQGSASERTATIDECEGLEPAAVWDPEHVEQRLRDHLEDSPNVHLATMQLVRPGQAFTVFLTRERDRAGNLVVSGRSHRALRAGDLVSDDPGIAKRYRISQLATYTDDAEVDVLLSGQSGALHIVPDGKEMALETGSRLYHSPPLTGGHQRE